MKWKKKVFKCLFEVKVKPIFQQRSFLPQFKTSQYCIQFIPFWQVGKPEKGRFGGTFLWIDLARFVPQIAWQKYYIKVSIAKQPGMQKEDT